jgi:uncharacterized RDD family membrane protein YckC
MISRLLSLLALGCALLSGLGFDPLLAQNPPPPSPVPTPATPADPAADQPAPGANPTTLENPEPLKAPTTPRRSRRTRSSRGNDAVIVGAPVNVRAGESVRDVVAVGSEVRIDGTVDSELVVVLGKTTLGPTARVGELIIVGGTFEADPAARLGQNPVVISPDALLAITNVVPPVVALAIRDWLKTGLLQARPLPWPHQSGWAWVIAGFCLLIYALIEILIPKSVQSTVTALQEKPGSAFLVGLLGTLLALPVVGLLLVSVVGAVIVPFLACALFGMLILGKASLYRHAGAALGTRIGARWLANPLPALVLGAAAFYALYSVPVFGGIVWMLAAPLAFGAVLLAALGRSKSVSDAPLAAAALSTVPGWVSGRRAGFWLRLLASLLDLALVFLVLLLIARRVHWFLPVWLLYHLLFWIGQGTTVGGIICGLRIVRVDGQPLSPGVAIVRLLGSVFSLAVAGIGFFWAGWSASKQSWHDKIAGTLVLREPNRAGTTGPTMQPGGAAAP